jgi:hypothetical protein
MRDNLSSNQLIFTFQESNTTMDVSWLADQLSLEDRNLLSGLQNVRRLKFKLKGEKDLEVRVRLRANKRVLGSVRLKKLARKEWHFSFAKSLFEKSPEDTLLLGKILLYRARKVEVPPKWEKEFSRLNHDQTDPQNTRIKSVRIYNSDPDLLRKIQGISKIAFPHIKYEMLPTINWINSRSQYILGKYYPREHRISIHSALNSAQVPPFVIDNLIHHELLHAILGKTGTKKYSRYHHSEFRRLEKNWPQYAESEIWIKSNFRRMINT